MFISKAYAAGTEGMPMPDNVDPAVFKYLFIGIGTALALFVVYKLVRLATRT